MAPLLETLGIDQMTLDDRIDLATAIWESIAAEQHPTLLAPAQQTELYRRLEDHLANPEDVVPWEQVKEEVTKRLTK